MYKKNKDCHNTSKAAMIKYDLGITVGNPVTILI